jgi:predicted anti-sigma-YlaC factor YlaD
MHIFHPIAVWNGVIAAGIGVGLAIGAPSPAAAVLYLAGSACMLVVGLTSEGVNRPIWRQIEKWDPALVADRWSQKRHRWYLAHEVRTYGAIGALAAYAAAVLVAMV